MSHRRYLLSLAILAALMIGLSSSARGVGAAGPAGRPNIVYILADDLGYGDARCYNPDCKIPTPHIDRLAGEGMRFTDAHSGSAVCSPTRYGLLTGRYAWRTKLRRGVLVPYDPPLIAADRLTVPGLLRQHGYRTACVGKWHLGWDWPMTAGQPQFDRPLANGPTTRGFERYFGTDVPNYPPYCFIQDDRTVGLPTARKETRDLSGRPGPMLPGWRFEAILPTLVDRAAGWLAARANEDGPFFLYLPLTSPHEPIAPSTQFKGKSGISDLADFMMETDWAVGQVLAALDKHHLAEKTLVIFAADNGHAKYTGLPPLQKTGHSVSGPFRGFKADIWEGGHRVPFIVRWPGVVQPATLCDETICHTNLLATCAEILNAKLPDTAGEDSFSILPLLRGTKQASPTHPAVVHQSGDGLLAIRQGKWKLVLGGAPAEDELFDLLADRSETKSVLSSHPDEADRLRELLQRYIDDGRSAPGARQTNDVPVPLRIARPRRSP